VRHYCFGQDRLIFAFSKTPTDTGRDADQFWQTAHYIESMLNLASPYLLDTAIAVSSCTRVWFGITKAPDFFKLYIPSSSPPSQLSNQSNLHHIKLAAPSVSMGNLKILIILPQSSVSICLEKRQKTLARQASRQQSLCQHQLSFQQPLQVRGSSYSLLTIITDFTLPFHQHHRIYQFSSAGSFISQGPPCPIHPGQQP